MAQRADTAARPPAPHFWTSPRVTSDGGRRTAEGGCGRVLFQRAGRTGWRKIVVVAALAGGGLSPLPVAAAAAPPAGHDCSLKPSPHASSRGEWASCVSVAASIDKAPPVGGTATLTVDVTAADDFSGVDVALQLPANLRFADAGGLSVGRGRVRGGSGTAQRGASRTAIARGATKRFAAQVTATAAGYGQITATATPVGTAADNPGGSDDVFLTVGSGGKPSHLGKDTSSTGSVTRVTGSPTATGPVGKTPAGSRLPRPAPGASAPSAPSTTSALPAGQAAVKGSWH